MAARRAGEPAPAARPGRASARRGSGELAHAPVPDLKESDGGLRDATVLKALVATWLVDVPARRPRAVPAASCSTCATCSRTAPAGPRTASRPSCGRRWRPGCGARPTREAAQRLVRGLGRRIAHLSRLTWSRVDHVLAPSARPRAPAARAAVAARWSRWRPGVALVGGRGGADRGADPADRPAAAAPGRRRSPPSAGRMLAPATAARLAARVRAAARAVARRGARPARPAARRRARAAGGLGDARRDRGAGPAAARSGSGSGCCRTPPPCTASPSTGTSSRPASRPRG